MIFHESEIVDYLPHIDGLITAEETHAVEQLIEREMSQNSHTLHPSVREITPLSEHPPLLMKTVEQMELEDPEAAHEPGSRPAVLLDRYTEFQDADEDVDRNRLYTTLSYAVLRERNAQLNQENSAELLRSQALVNARTEEVVEMQSQELSRKRSRVEELNGSRSAKQIQFQPVAGYLEQRWKEGVTSLVDRGIELSVNSAT